MANFRFHQISNTKKIRYISEIFKNSSFIVFLHGFMSDLEGKKPNSFLKFAKKNKDKFFSTRILWSWEIFWKICKWKYFKME